MQAYISTFFCREYNIPCQKKVQQNQIKNIIFLLLGGALWVAPTSLVPLVHSQYILCVVAGGMLCIPPTGTQTILQAQTIRTVVLALLVPLVHSQDNTCVVADGMLCIPPTGTQTILHSFQPLCFSYICQAVRKRPVGKYKKSNPAGFAGLLRWCRWSDSNRHGGLVHRILSPARLPVSPHRLIENTLCECFFGDPPEIRTPDHRIKSAVLYRLS